MRRMGSVGRGGPAGRAVGGAQLGPRPDLREVLDVLVVAGMRTAACSLPRLPLCGSPHLSGSALGR